METTKQDNLREATKRETAVRRLSAMARQLGPGAKLPRFLELRTDLDIGSATLDAVLKELAGQGIIERRHGVGIFVSERLHHRNVVLLCNPAFFRDGEGSPFWDMLVHHARVRAADMSEDFALYFARDGAQQPKLASLLPESLVLEITAGRVHGILGVGLGAVTAQWIEARDIPFVAFAGYGAFAVSFDDVALVRMGVAALAERGCRRLALWSSVTNHGGHVCREDVLRRPTIAAFLAEIEAQGLLFEPELVRTNAYLYPEDPAECAQEGSIPSPQEQGRLAVGKVFGADADPRLRPDGIVCTDDSLMQGALPYLTRLGVSIGTDVQIATHANAGSSVLYGYEDLMIRMEVDPAHLVRQMYVRLEAQREGRVTEVPQACLAPTLHLPDSEPTAS